jgi:prepilin-type processing-associated H-X9-DG protein
LRGTRLNSGADKEPWLSKYTTITFNKKGAHRKWETLRKAPRGGASPSDWTAVYCGQGEFTPFPESNKSPTRRANIGSHKNNGVGGTNAVFADTHVEWIPGKNLGRP